jgi:hypothetical protein
MLKVTRIELDPDEYDLPETEEEQIAADIRDYAFIKAEAYENISKLKQRLAAINPNNPTLGAL